MANTKIVVYGVSTANGRYIPLQVDTSGVTIVSINSITPGVVFPISGSGSSTTDGQAGIAGTLAQAENFNYGYNGATWDRARVANIFKSVSATASGSTAVWTPAAGKKFRLMGYSISVAGTLAVLGADVLNLLDSATVIFRHVVAIGATVSGDSQIAASLGQGYLSAVADQVLNINIGTALLTGAVTVNAWGTEE